MTATERSPGPRTAAAPEDWTATALRRRLASFPRRPMELRGRRWAAVAVVLSPSAGAVPEWGLFLTRRSARLQRHRGQWALPGGRVDEGENALEASARELSEELAIEIPPRERVGLLDDYATRSGYVMTPVVYLSEAPLSPVPDPSEVASVHHVTFREMIHPEMPRLTTIEESDRPVLSIPVGGGFVFSPTAAVVYQCFAWLVERRLVRVAGYEQPVFAWR